MHHCNSVFDATDIWFLIDNGNIVKRRLYLACCPICSKKIALYSEVDSLTNKVYQKYYYSNGATKIMERLKNQISYTKLELAGKIKVPFGFKYGKNKEIKKNGIVIGSKQYASDFWGNKVLVKIVYD